MGNLTAIFLKMSKSHPFPRPPPPPAGLTLIGALILVIKITSRALKTPPQEAPREANSICTYQRPSRGVDPGDIRGNSAGFADYCRQVLARFRGKIHGERPAGFATSPLKIKKKIRTGVIFSWFY